MKKNNKIVISLIIFSVFGLGILFAACKPEPEQVIETPIPSVEQELEGTAEILMPVDEEATITLTPFQPSLPTATNLSPTETMTVIPSEPSAELLYDYLYPPVYEQSYFRVPLIPQPKKQINVLVLGTDHFGDRRGYRTDAIILVTINKKEDTVNVTSFPRDLYVYIPGWTVQRINTAFPYGGFESLADTMEYNFGVRPDYYALIHVSFLEEIVNDLGGITVHVEKTLCDRREEYSGQYCLFPGERYMDGPTAFWYARSRHTSENDFGRNRRHQEILRGLFDKALEVKALTKIPKLYQTYQDNIETNIGLGVLLQLIPTASKLQDRSRITQYFITQNEVINWKTGGGASVLIPQPRLVRDVLLEALNSSEEPSH